MTGSCGLITRFGADHAERCPSALESQLRPDARPLLCATVRRCLLWAPKIPVTKRTGTWLQASPLRTLWRCRRSGKMPAHAKNTVGNPAVGVEVKTGPRPVTRVSRRRTIDRYARRSQRPRHHSHRSNTSGPDRGQREPSQAPFVRVECGQAGRVAAETGTETWQALPRASL